MEVIFLFFLVVLIPSRCIGDEQNFGREQLIPSAYKLADNIGKPENKRSSYGDPNTLVLFEILKLSREMNGLKDQIENQAEELKRLKQEYKQFKDEQDSDLESLKIETRDYYEKLENSLTETTTIQNNQGQEIQELKDQLSETENQQERDVVRLMNDTQKLQGYIDICMPTCNCPNDYEPYKRGRLCYKFYPQQCDNWDRARTKCREDGGDLIVFSDKTDMTFFQNLARGITIKSRCDNDLDGYWVGLTDQDTEGTWKWVDGRLAGQEIPWNPHEPNNKRGQEHFAHLWKNKGFAFNDVHGDHRNSFICAIQ